MKKLISTIALLIVFIALYISIFGGGIQNLKYFIHFSAFLFIFASFIISSIIFGLTPPLIKYTLDFMNSEELSDGTLHKILYILKNQKNFNMAIGFLSWIIATTACLVKEDGYHMYGKYLSFALMSSFYAILINYILSFIIVKIENN